MCVLCILQSPLLLLFSRLFIDTAPERERRHGMCISIIFLFECKISFKFSGSDNHTATPDPISSGSASGTFPTDEGMFLLN